MAYTNQNIPEHLRTPNNEVSLIKDCKIRAASTNHIGKSLSNCQWDLSRCSSFSLISLIWYNSGVIPVSSQIIDSWLSISSFSNKGFFRSFASISLLWVIALFCNFKHWDSTFNFSLCSTLEPKLYKGE